MLVRIREELKKAEDDKDVRALLVRINSPGGTVTASDIMYREIESWKQQRSVAQRIEPGDRLVCS